MTTTSANLEQARSAFDRGDFATARRLCRELESAGDPELGRQAGALRKQMGTDRLEIAIITACLLFFAWTVWRYFL